MSQRGCPFRGSYGHELDDWLLKSKIHRAITDGNLDYEGSLTIASDLMTKCGLILYGRIQPIVQ